MRRTKEQKGITLIALIITIVVLLILAVVAINSIQNDGILSHAGNVANTYNQAVQNEADTLQNYLDYLNGQNGGSTTYKAYTTEDEVTVGSETFYVIADSSETEEMVLLLAKENIDTENLVQSASAAPVAFSTESYWGEGTSPYDIVEPETIPESHTAAKAAYDYGVKVGGTGRLMTYSEADDLSKTDFSTKLYETNFWLGSAYGPGYVWIVPGGGSALNGSTFGVASYFGVRPVVEISKDLVEPVTE